jgi:hypothetical protein
VKRGAQTGAAGAEDEDVGVQRGDHGPGGASIVYAEGSGLNARGSQSGRRRLPGPGAGRVIASHSR